jgi:ABC-type transport system involved in multi-copper enzyme maturation permease subunit
VSLLRLIPELPLLRRELIELSNRRRTYIVRFVGAIIILSIVMVQYFRVMQIISQTANPGGGWVANKFNGSGGVIFSALVPMLFHSVQLLMPALTCGAVTIEKERNTLGTLFVTRLSPMTIILEKLASRLVPMLTFLLLTFPVLAFVYSLGGVDTTVLLSTLWLLLCECVFYASIGLLCSSWFSTTASAFICSYIVVGIIVMFSQVLGLGYRYPVVTPFDVWNFAFGGMNDYRVYMSNRGWLQQMLFEALRESSAAEGGLLMTRVMLLISMSVPSLMASGFFVLLARFFLIRRAFVSSSSVLLRVFKRVDTFFSRLNDNTTGGVVLIKDYDSLPLFDPVAWRERSKKSLGKARYLFRVLIVLEGPVLFICLAAADPSATAEHDGLRVLLFLMWAIAAMILSMKASTMISSERTRETLEALLSTPMSSREIISQKAAGLHRLMIVLSIPILTIHLTLALMNFDIVQIIRSLSLSTLGTSLLYGIMVTATTYTSMSLVVWLSALMGLRSPTQARSVMSAITVLGLWLASSAYLLTPGGPGYNFGMATMSSFFGIEEASGFDNVLYTMGMGNDSRRILEQQEKIERLMATISSVSCLIRPDGSIWANESILASNSLAGISKTAPFYAFSRFRPTAVLVAVLVLAWHIVMMLLFRELTLKLAPRLLQRLDDGVSVSISQPDKSVATLASEGVI